MQAAFITRSFMSPITEELTFTAPALSAAAELNYGATDRADSRRPCTTSPSQFIPWVLRGLEAQNHTREAHPVQARIMVDWLSKELGMGSRSLLAAQVKEAAQVLQPFATAGEMGAPCHSMSRM